MLVELGNFGTNLVRTLALILLVVAFRSIPAMLLERDLHFKVIAFAETTGLVIYQIVLVVLVWYGVGVSSIIWGLIARYLSDLLIILYNYPWRPKLSLRIQVILPYIGFGLNMQGVRLASYAKDQLPLLLLVPLLGVASAGEWGWALSYVGLPMYFLRLTDRAMFPAYSRVQGDRRQLSMLVDQALWLNLIIGLPLLVILVMLAPLLVGLIYGKVWLSTLPIINVLFFNMVGGLITGTAFPVLYGVGKSKSAFKLFTIWLALTCVGSIIGIYTAQLFGIAVAFAFATSVIAIVMLFMLRDVVDVKPLQVFATPIIGSLGAAAFAKFAVSIDMYWLSSIVLTLGIYIVIIYCLDAPKIHQFAKKVILAP
jgi:PST family polysaccharide transporter